MATVEIRDARRSDAAELAGLFHASIHAIAALHYSPGQVAAWSPAPPDPQRFVARIEDGRTFLVAVDEEDAILAYADLEADGHIDHFYARPDAAGTGIAALLYEALEQRALAAAIARLYVEASEPARRFFERRGFSLVARNDFAICGVAIHNYRMEKRLD